MLTAEENDLLCRVEGDAPMGQMMRRHWIPACLPRRSTEPDGTPVQVSCSARIVVFRDSDGRLGALDEHCPHRRASLSYGRNEEGGLALPLSRLEVRRRTATASTWRPSRPGAVSRRR